MSDDFVSSSASHHSKSTASHRRSRLDKFTKSDHVTNLAKAPWRACVAFVIKLKKLGKKPERVVVPPAHLQRRHSSTEPSPITPVTTFRPLSLYVERKPERVLHPWNPHFSIPSGSAPLALSPPPRHIKRDYARINAVPAIKESLGGPPSASKSVTNKPLTLRLSLDAEEANTSSLYHSPSSISDDSDFGSARRDEDTSSIQTGQSDRPGSRARTITPHRSGTLGGSSIKYNLPEWSDTLPLPTDVTRQSSIANLDLSDTGEDSNTALSLKERRRKKSPLSIPDADQLTLSISARSSVYSDTARTDSSQSSVFRKDTHRDSHAKTSTHRADDVQQQYSVDIHQSRQNAMLALEGKSTRDAKASPLLGGFEMDGVLGTSSQPSNIRLSRLELDKVQYEAVVAMHRRQHSSPYHAEDSSYYIKAPENGVGFDSPTHASRRGNYSVVHNDMSELPLSPADHVLIPPTPSSSTQRDQQLSPNAQTPGLGYYPSSPSSLGTASGDTDNANDLFTKSFIQKKTV